MSKNIIRWIPVIWNDRDWDWDFLAGIMETKLNWMAKSSTSWWSGHSDVHGRQMRVCVQLLHRLREDDYVENAFKRFGESKFAYKHAMAQSKEDQRYLGVILGKYLNHWWD